MSFTPTGFLSYETQTHKRFRARTIEIDLWYHVVYRCEICKAAVSVECSGQWFSGLISGKNDLRCTDCFSTFDTYRFPVIQSLADAKAAAKKAARKVRSSGPGLFDETSG